MFILRHSIIKRLLVVVFSLYMVLTITITLAHMDFEYNFSKRQTIEALSNIEQMVHGSVSQAIWEFNGSQLTSIIRGLYKNQYIVGIKLAILGQEGLEDFDAGMIGLIENDEMDIEYVDPETHQVEPSKESWIKLIPNNFEIMHTDAFGRQLVIGKMSLYSSNKIVFDQVKDSFILLIINAIIKTIALWVFFLWAGYHFISKPLLQLIDAIKQLSLGNWPSELMIKKIKEQRKTEINSLFETFNDMLHKLHNTQNKLQYSNNRLKNIFDTMPSALCSLKNQYIIHGWNQAMINLTGIPANLANGKDIRKVYPVFIDFLPAVNSALHEQEQQQIKNAKIIDPNTSAVKLFDIVIYPVPSVTPAEVVIRIDDVTEEEKKEANLTQTEKLASVGASIAGVAHEINNPLASIMQTTQNILRRIEPERAANIAVANEVDIDLAKLNLYLLKREIINFLNDIHQSGQRASSIVKNMLQFTRRSASQMSKHDLRHIIEDSLQLAATDYNLQEQFDFKQIEIIKNIPETPLFLECHPMEIQQVLLNLIKNAVQAIPHEQQEKIIKLAVKTYDDKIEISVSDNGSGMNEETMKQIFQPFFTTKPVGSGTGLGLSVCRNIIMQKHHGDMSVDSTENVGTTFTIVLPIKQI